MDHTINGSTSAPRLTCKDRGQRKRLPQGPIRKGASAAKREAEMRLRKKINLLPSREPIEPGFP
jgi:hypothetical protein